MTLSPRDDPRPRAEVRATHRHDQGRIACEIVENVFVVEGVGGVVSLDSSLASQYLGWGGTLFVPLPDDSPDTWFPVSWDQLNELAWDDGFPMLTESAEGHDIVGIGPEEVILMFDQWWKTTGTRPDYGVGGLVPLFSSFRSGRLRGPNQHPHVTFTPQDDPRPRARVRATHRHSDGRLACELFYDIEEPTLVFALEGGGVFSTDSASTEESRRLFAPLPDDSPDSWFPMTWLQLHQITLHATAAARILYYTDRVSSESLNLSTIFLGWLNEQTSGTRLQTAGPADTDDQ
ncbi:hypothetical protein [Rhodococcus sp. NPDC049939]|uniref:hypothetical protein n=1 Tax=Rhodococcus sp. NPDC049939 TaxID=3155511 RepID=UPI0033F6217F